MYSKICNDYKATRTRIDESFHAIPYMTHMIDTIPYYSTHGTMTSMLFIRLLT